MMNMERNGKETDYDASKLAPAAAGGDSAAFGKLYELYFDRIYRYLYYRTLHRETAEDLCSKTFLKALDKLSGFKPSKGSFGSWIYRIALNSLIDHYRASSKIEFHSGVWDHPSDGDHVMDVHNKLYWEKLKPALEELPSEKRELIILRVWDDLSFREIAELTGKSEAACKMSFSRTLKFLKDSVPFSVLMMFIAFKTTVI
ncbi:MAG: RNA polymerase sigma factor [Spirochaetales bacterium]|uniref:RNA polymerase sigma factor n=1 Tax=Candidatus Thalassospirochaeta sargassi TaxID=3119039 RepID=A0AAJ1MJX9_9SPIO|nr:RNA polymerase sigma factor [Spirochaetales bacterium]